MSGVCPAPGVSLDFSRLPKEQQIHYDFLNGFDTKPDKCLNSEDALPVEFTDQAGNSQTGLAHPFGRVSTLEAAEAVLIRYNIQLKPAIFNACVTIGTSLPAGYEEYDVVRVVDGDTYKIRRTWGVIKEQFSYLAPGIDQSIFFKEERTFMGRDGRLVTILIPRNDKTEDDVKALDLPFKKKEKLKNLLFPSVRVEGINTTEMAKGGKTFEARSKEAQDGAAYATEQLTALLKRYGNKVYITRTKLDSYKRVVSQTYLKQANGTYDILPAIMTYEGLGHSYFVQLAEHQYGVYSCSIHLQEMARYPQPQQGFSTPVRRGLWRIPEYDQKAVQITSFHPGVKDVKKEYPRLCNLTHQPIDLARVTILGFEDGKARDLKDYLTGPFLWFPGRTLKLPSGGLPWEVPGSEPTNANPFVEDQRVNFLSPKRLWGRCGATITVKIDGKTVVTFEHKLKEKTKKAKGCE